MNARALIISIAAPVAMAALGGFLTGKGGLAWFASLRRPRFQVPLWTFFVVAAIVYLMYGIVIYRLLTLYLEPRGRALCLTAVGVCMLYSEYWNHLFFGLKSTLAGFVAITAFLPLIVIVETALFLFEPVSAWVLLPYAIYFAGYDIPWSLRLWALNPNGTPRV
jgi:translocator protein